MGVYLLKSPLKCPFTLSAPGGGSSAGGATAKAVLSREEAGFGANGWTGALGTVRPAKASLEPITIPPDRGWSTGVGEAFSDSALEGSAYALANRCGTRSVEPWDIAEDILPGAGHPATQICQVWDPQEKMFMGTVQKHTADGSGNVNLPLILDPQTFRCNACRETADGSD